MRTNPNLLSAAYFVGDSLQLHLKFLESTADLQEYALLYHRKHGVWVDIDYLKNSDAVIVFLDKCGKWQGGFVINSQIPLRYLAPFDAPTKQIILRSTQMKESELAEITCIWISTELTKQNKYARLLIYEKALEFAASSNKKYIIGGSVQYAVYKTFELILPHTLYFGYVPFGTDYQLGKIVYNTPEDALIRLQNYYQQLIQGEL